MGKLIRAKDWSKTSLGPIETWPSSLQTTLGVVLRNRFAMMIWWGPELLNFYNDAYTPILRDKHPAALGMPAPELWPEIWDFAGPLARGIMEGGPATWMEDVQLFIKSGAISEETYFTFSYSPIPGSEGGVAGLLNTVQETTQKVQGERQIQLLYELAARASEAKSRDDAHRVIIDVLDTNKLDVPFALLYTVHEGTHTLTRKTPGAKEVHSWPLDKATQSVHELVVGDSAIILPLKRAGRLATETLLVLGIAPNRKLDERYRRFFKSVANQVTNILANAQSYEMEAKRAEELAELDKAKTVFFSNVSHEFRTPLTLMLGPLEESLARTDLPVEHRERLELMHRNTLRLQKLVNSLLDFSRIEAGKMKSTFQAVELGGFTRGIASSFESAVTAAKLAFIVDCDHLDEKVYIDPEQWETIVLNLLSNALKFTFKGHIKIAVRSTGSFAELIVEDSGTGIAPEELEHLFERFNRISGAKSRTAEGSGIGLALVQELVKLHGGTIAVQSKLARGTTFTVRLPFGTSHLPKDQIMEARQNKTALSNASKAFSNEALAWFKNDQNKKLSAKVRSKLRSLKSRWDETILVVDDNADMREYIYGILNPNVSLKVETVENGQAALKAIKRRLPSLIITDIMMPGMDGFELVSKIRQNKKAAQVPIIFLSARAGEHEKVEGIAENVDAYLTKPFSAKELVATVRAQLDLAKLRRRK